MAAFHHQKPANPHWENWKPAELKAFSSEDWTDEDEKVDEDPLVAAVRGRAPAVPPPTPIQQKAARFQTHGSPIRIVDAAVPKIEVDEVLVRLEFVGMCEMDTRTWMGTNTMGDVPQGETLPIGGHEGVGVVEQCGAAVANVHVGDRVGVGPINGLCLACDFCEHGFEANCPGISLSGITRDGCFQQFVALKACCAIPVPEGLDGAAVVPILCAGVSVYRALKEAHVRPGQMIVINGAGSVRGRLAIQFARAMGMRVIAVADVEPYANTGGHAGYSAFRALGAETFIGRSANGPDAYVEVMCATDGGAHGVLNTVDTVEEVERAMEFVRPRGTVVLMDGGEPNAKISIDWALSVQKCVNVKGSFLGTREDAAEALGFLTRGMIEVPKEIHPFVDLPEIAQRLRDGQLRMRSIVLDMRDVLGSASLESCEFGDSEPL